MKLLSVCVILQTLAAASAFTVAPRAPVVSSKTQLAMDPMFGKTSPGVTSKTAGWELHKISPQVRIEGLTRHSFQFTDASREITQVALHSGGRPVNADIELWVGPDWTPVKVHAYSEDGKQFPVQTLVGTRNKPANVEIRNTNTAEYPINAAASYAIEPLANARLDIASQGPGRYVEGGSKFIQSFAADVDQLQVLLETDGKMLNAKIEMLNGPNNVKQEFEIFTNNGQLNSLFVVFETPGQGNSVRVTNLATMEFPLNVYFHASETNTRGSNSIANWN